MIPCSLNLVDGVAAGEAFVYNMRRTEMVTAADLVCDLASYSSPSARYLFGLTPLISASSSFVVDMVLAKDTASGYCYISRTALLFHRQVSYLDLFLSKSRSIQPTRLDSRLGPVVMRYDALHVQWRGHENATCSHCDSMFRQVRQVKEELQVKLIHQICCRVTRAPTETSHALLHLRWY